MGIVHYCMRCMQLTADCNCRDTTDIDNYTEDELLAALRRKRLPRLKQQLAELRQRIAELEEGQ